VNKPGEVKIGAFKWKISPLLWSFSLNFRKPHSIIDTLFKEADLTDNELSQFVDVCDNRFSLSRTLLRDIMFVMGFDFIALSVIVSAIASFSPSNGIMEIIGPGSRDPFLFFVFWFAIVGMIILFGLGGICRRSILLWTAFRETAILLIDPSRFSPDR